MKNLIFIPCYNDIKNCEKILDEIYKLPNKNFDILIINDGSYENLKFKSNLLNIIIINLNNNFGVGLCMKIAINYAIQNNYKKFCRIDSDGEHDPYYIEKIICGLDNKDFIIGERCISQKENILKIFSKKILNVIINKIFKLKFTDYNCGMMGLNSTSMRIISKSNLINYTEPQIIIKLCVSKLAYDTIKIDQRKRYYGDSSIHFLKGIDFILVTFVFILNYIMNKDD